MPVEFLSDEQAAAGRGLQAPLFAPRVHVARRRSIRLHAQIVAGKHISIVRAFLGVTVVSPSKTREDLWRASGALIHCYYWVLIRATTIPLHALSGVL